MKIPDDILAKIHEKAATLTERFGEELINGEIPDRLSLAQLAKWDRHVSTAHGPQLQQRKSWFLAEKERIRAQQKDHKKTQQELSGWISLFRQVLERYSRDHIPKAGSHDLLDPRAPVAFEEVLLPFVEQGDKLLGTGANDVVVHPNARRNCLRILSVELSKLSAACFYEHFKAFKREDYPATIREPADASGNQHYRAYVQQLFNGGIVGFFEQYSSLARLLTLTVTKWVQGTGLLFDRLRNDKPAFKSLFFKDKDPGKLVSVRTGLSGAHTTAGQVAILKFSGGYRLVYKPRSPDGDMVLNRLIEWINEQANLLPHYLPKVLDKDAYSWQEYIPYTICREEQEVRDFYTRIGHLAGLLQVLGSTDYHFGNIRAMGAFPVLTDNETLFSPWVKLDPHATFSGDCWLEDGILHSLARSHFLLDLQKLFYPDPESINGVYENQSSYTTKRIKQVNRDHMRLVKVSVNRKGQNIPRFRGKTVNPYAYRSQILGGYLDILSFLQVNRQAFHTLVRTITRNFDRECRVLIRPTAYYLNLLLELRDPDNLENGLDRSLAIDKLSAAYMPAVAISDAQLLLSREIEMMEQQLIPWFHGRLDQDRYDPAVINLPSIFTKSAKQVFEEHIRDLGSENYVARQIAIVEHYLAEPGSRQDQDPKFFALNPQGAEERELAHIICSIGDNIRFCYEHFHDLGLANKIRDESSGWMRHYQLSDGLSGIILLMAALSRFTGKPAYRDLVYCLVEPLKEALQSGTPEPGTLENWNDTGSIIRSLQITGKLLQDDSFTGLAADLRRSFPPEPDRNDHFPENGWAQHSLPALMAALQQVKGPDHLSNGLAGYLEAILQNHASPEKEKITAGIVEKYRRNGKFMLSPHFMHVMFYEGIAGILYQYLRWLFPDEFPAVIGFSQTDEFRNI